MFSLPKIKQLLGPFLQYIQRCSRPTYCINHWYIVCGLFMLLQRSLWSTQASPFQTLCYCRAKLGRLQHDSSMTVVGFRRWIIRRTKYTAAVTKNKHKNKRPKFEQRLKCVVMHYELSSARYQIMPQTWLSRIWWFDRLILDWFC